MFFQRLKSLFRKPAAETTSVDSQFLHSPERFFALLESERMRADRTKTLLSLVVFKLPAAGLHDAAVQEFVGVLRHRLRATDHAGFFGKCGNSIGVILWNTDTDGALNFVDAVNPHGEEGRPLEHQLYVYPLETPADDDSAGTGLCDKSNGGKLENTGSPADPKSMEVLFVKPLPFWKRAFDVVAATAGILMLSPLLLVTAVLIKLTSRGGVLFKQQRTGLGGKPFTIYKFRTMCLDAEAQTDALRKHSEQDGPAFKLKTDPRITPIGRYLRKTCIDELPQLWNVLKGDMTLVGPRPLWTVEAEKVDGWGRRRLEVTPGLTCIWQVHGKSRVPFTEWMRMDLRYIKVRNFGQDLKLVVQTAIAVVLHRASQ